MTSFFVGLWRTPSLRLPSPFPNFLEDQGNKVSRDKSQLCQTIALGNDWIQPMLAFPLLRTLKQKPFGGYWLL